MCYYDGASCSSKYESLILFDTLRCEIGMNGNGHPHREIFLDIIGVKL